MPGVLTDDQKLEEFWGWRPPLLERHPDHTKSAKTRPPTHYDTHLHKSLILKRIVRLPSLLTDLENVVDKAVDAARPFLPRTKKTSEFPHPWTRKQAVDNLVTSLHDEEGVANFYMNTTAKFCAPVASMLGLQHAEWISSLIWDRQTHQKASAIADGFLKINTKVETDDFLRSPLKEEAKNDLNAIAQAKFLHLAVWEFKSLLAGDIEVMQAIGSHSGSFHWQACTKVVDSCGTKKHLKHGRLTSTGSPKGFDALETPWDIKREVSGDHKRKRGRDDDDGDYSPNRNAVGEKAHDIIQQVKVFIRSSHQNTNCSGFRKTWAEAVHSDATLMIFSSGNFEFIGVRHRDSQTLFLSPLIEVQSIPTYAKLHTGLYIAAFRDTAARAVHLRDAKKLPPSWTHKYYPDEECDGDVVTEASTSQDVRLTCDLP
jgi:hypothetical protein